MAKGYRITWPKEPVAWRVLDFMGGSPVILEDLSIFLGVKGDWPTVLGEFRRRYGDVEGVWLTRRLHNALLNYGEFYKAGLRKWVILEYNYDPKNIIFDLGSEGIFVINPSFVQERGVDPLLPLKKDLGRIFRWSRYRPWSG